MAYRPSQRRSFEIEPTEPNLTPIMNLMVVLIPLLLSSAEFVKLGVIDLNLPPAAGPLQASVKLPREGTRSLDLLLMISETQFVVSCSLPQAVFRNKQQLVILWDAKEALMKLQDLLYFIKQKTPNYYRNRNRIRIQASTGVKYQLIIDVIETARTIKRKNSKTLLFPVVQLSAGVL